MAAFVLIAFSVGVDLYKVGVRCWESGFSIENILNVLREIHDEVRASKYLECINEIYESKINNNNNHNFHRIGISCVNCRRKMICETIENAIEVDACEEAFEVISNAVSVLIDIIFFRFDLRTVHISIDKNKERKKSIGNALNTTTDSTHKKIDIRNIRVDITSTCWMRAYASFVCLSVSKQIEINV